MVIYNQSKTYKMIKFRLKEDWYLEDFFDKVKIYDAGHIFSPIEDGKYIINGLNDAKMSMSFDDMLKATNNGEPLFESINEQEIELTIEEVPEDKDNEVKNWRIQLDVKTSLKNLKKIEVFIKENIQEML
jgi:hypothetical protein